MVRMPDVLVAVLGVLVLVLVCVCSCAPQSRL